MEENKKRILKIDLVGENESLFENLRSKLIKTVNKVLDASIDVNSNQTVKDELRNLASLGLDFAKSKLAKPGIENDKMLAEIEEKISIIEKNNAETRKLHVEARRLEFDQSLRELTFALKMSKAIINVEDGEEAIAFTKQIDIFIEAVNSLKEMNRLE
jgi:hypothetical protein|tara:strand:- start:388 stop:861 length:474 start_codon:yes stop_codon:yes gene_type:complete